MSFSIAWGSCNQPRNSSSSAALNIINRYGCKVFIGVGDLPYIGENANAWGISALAIDKNSTISDIETRYDQLLADPGIARMVGEITTYWMADDHEWMGNDWDHTIAGANGNPYSLSLTNDATGQGEANAHWLAANTAWINKLGIYNPANNDGVSPEVPTGAESFSQTPPVTNYPVKYFRAGYDIGGNISTSPHVELFVLDCISYCSPVAAIDNSSKTMLGINQKAWLKAQLSASTATFKLIVTSRKTLSNSGADNLNTWAVYSTEFQELQAYIDTNSITGIAWLSGDRHIPSIEVQESPADTYDHLCIVSCPFGQPYAADSRLVTIDSQTRWAKVPTDAAAIPHAPRNFAFVEINNDYIEFSICKTSTGGKLWRGGLLAGTNKLVYPDWRDKY